MSERSRVALQHVVAALLAVGSIVYGFLYFLQTRDLGLSLLFLAGIPLAILMVALAAWVARDAQHAGLPRGPWIVAVLLAPGLGLVGYLLARELAAPSKPGGTGEA